MLKKIGLLLAVLGMSVGLLQAQEPNPQQDTLYQVSTLGALLVGGYDGAASFEEVSQHGDFGLGTFEAVDGEMIAFDGNFYQIVADGSVHPVQPEQLTPFAAVTFFEVDQTVTVDSPLPCAEFYTYLDQTLPSMNRFYAIKITGTFDYLKTRSPYPQTKPYPPLADVVASQAVFEFEGVEAILVGFWLPQYMQELNAAAYHFHGLTADLSAGGHVLDCTVANVTVEIDYTDQLEMSLPSVDSFDALDLVADE